MVYKYTSYIWLLVISFTILIFLAYYSMRYGRIKGSKAFGLCMLNFSFWVFTNGLEIAAVDLPTKLFWANMQYFSYTTIHIFWLYMVLRFIEQDDWISRKRMIFLYIIPAIIIALVWTDHYHGLFRYGFTLDNSGFFPVIDKSYGPLYWIHPIYGYTIVLISIVLITKAAFIHRSIYRMQAIALLVSPIISIVPSVLYVLSLSPVQGFDITPAFLGLSGLIAAIGLFRYQLFAIVPVARDVAVDNMNIGMIVIDTRNIIVDINLTAERQLGKKAKDLMGFKVEKTLSFLGVKWQILEEEKEIECTIFSEYSENEINLEIQLLKVNNKNNKIVGKIVLIRDITEIRKTQNQLLSKSKEFSIAKERERLANDLHDNLGQVLGFINVQAQGIRRELEMSGIKQSAENLSKLVQITQLAHNEIREYITETRNPSKVNKDFIASLLSTIEGFKNQTEIETILKIPDEIILDTLNEDHKKNVLYIIKEALNNIRKHSKAENVKIILLTQEKKLVIHIEDDGKGFDISQIDFQNTNNYGLRIMKKRALAIGANLTVSSELKKGTNVHLEIFLVDH